MHLTRFVVAGYCRATLFKTLLVMKLTVLFLVICVHTSAGGFSQRVTLKMENVTLKEVFNQLQTQSDFYFTYTDAVLQKVGKIDVAIVDRSLDEALNIILKPLYLTYSYNGKLIVVTPSIVQTDLKKDAPPVTGVVRGPDGQPLAGVNVMVKGTKKGVVTDAYGRFSIDAEQGKNISSIEYWV